MEGLFTSVAFVLSALKSFTSSNEKNVPEMETGIGPLP